MENNKKYWKGLEELHETPEFKGLQGREFAEELPVEEVLSEGTLSTPTPRRNFLKAMGFGVGAVTLAACNRAPVNKAVPYLIKPEEITPGVANYYASTYNGYGVIVKTREGRPIKIEGNPASPINKGGVCAQGQASVLDLYDNNRLNGPMLNGNASSWDVVDTFLKEQLTAISTEGKGIRVLASSILSPSTKALLDEFTAKYPTTKLITYDTISASAIINANRNSFDKPTLPSYRFDNAQVIVSFDADFLGSWISPVEFTKQYVFNRNAFALKANKSMSRHIQIESTLSLTGSNADKRITLKPSQQGVAVLALYNALAKSSGAPTFNVSGLEESKQEAIEATAKELLVAKGKSLVVSGSNDVSVQVVINAINSLLGSYGVTIDLDNASNQKQGTDVEVTELVKEMNSGAVGALFVLGVNPAYTLPNPAAFTEALKKVKLTVSFADRVDETAVLCAVVAPDNHYLESWGDAETRRGVYAIVQPTINPVYNTRQAQQTFLNLADNVASYYEYLTAYWNTNVYPKNTTGESFNAFWQNVLRDGHFIAPALPSQSYTFTKDLTAVAETIKGTAKASSGVELTLYTPVIMGDGANGNNPWLLEMPDPVSKVSWDNYVAVSKKQADEWGVKDNDVVEVKSANHSVKLPIVIQPGQIYGSASIALGYGRTAAGKAGNNVGKNAFPFVSILNGSFQNIAAVTITKTAEVYELAVTQTHTSIEGRDIVRETTLGEYQEDPTARSGKRHKEKMYDLWYTHRKDGHHWGMAVDLNACTGCSACIVSCSAENNVAVVGREEVLKRREMHWIRIDRYYTFNEGDKSATREKEYNHFEDFENVSVVHQPMMCQHCDHAPCESVCPVLATMHSSEGLNQMVYNRCFGTRYCANNCPYKVRRFNWFDYANNNDFDYHMNNDMGKMVLNPDVTVRSRGVMEKCSMCVQRIQAGKLEAKVAKAPLLDGKIQTACSSSCPADAIVFGDINDPNSKVSQLLKDERVFYVLEELNVQPGIGYLTMVRNTEKKATHAEHGAHHEG